MGTGKGVLRIEQFQDYLAHRTGYSDSPTRMALWQAA